MSFYHRVLPKPQGQPSSQSHYPDRHHQHQLLLETPSSPTLTSNGQDRLLLQSTIMPEVVQAETDKRLSVSENSKASRSSSTISSYQPAGSLRSTSLDSLPDYEASPTVTIETALPVRIGQKRTASLITNAAADSRYQHRGLPSLSSVAETASSPLIHSAATSADPASATSQVCLCQPDPKVPRPRNGE